MRQLTLCRRTFIAAMALGCLTALGLVNGVDVSMSIATVALGLAASNAAEGIGKARQTYRSNDAG